MSLCSACFCEREDGGAVPCPSCGWHAGQECAGPYLAVGTLLAGKYRVGRCLGNGGFGITYLCRDENLKVLVAVKEYFPQQLAQRRISRAQVSSFSGKNEDYSYGLEQFLREAQMLAVYRDHPNIVSILDYFRENGTGYMVMEYLPGCTFEQYLVEHQGRLPPTDALEVLTPVMDALRAVHADGVVHRDVSPDNIVLLRDGRVKIIDFGAARRALKQKSQALSIILREGYAPFEQYQTQGAQGAWSDVYALAATFYRAIVGQPPPMATDRVATDRLRRPSELGIQIDPDVERVLLRGLAVMSQNRYQEMGAFLLDLRRAAGLDQSLARQQQRPTSSRRAWWLLAALAGGALAAVLVAVLKPTPETAVTVSSGPVLTPVPVVVHSDVPSSSEDRPFVSRSDVVVLRPRTAAVAKVKCPQAVAVYASPFRDDAPIGSMECDRSVTVLGQVFGAPRAAVRWGETTAYVAADALAVAVPKVPARQPSTDEDNRTLSQVVATTVEAVPVSPSASPVALPQAECVIPASPQPGLNLAGCNLRGRNLRGVSLSGANLSKADLSGSDLVGADLSNANLRGANLSSADLRDAKLERANADDADFRRARLGKVVRNLLFRRANLRETELRGVRFIESVGDGADFTRANLVDAEFPSSSLKGAVFFAADLKDTYWVRADLTGIDLRQARNIPEDELRKAYACDTDLHKPQLRGCSGVAGMVENLVSDLIKGAAAQGGKQ